MTMQDLFDEMKALRVKIVDLENQVNDLNLIKYPDSVNGKLDFISTEIEAIHTRIAKLENANSK